MGAVLDGASGYGLVGMILEGRWRMSLDGRWVRRWGRVWKRLFLMV